MSSRAPHRPTRGRVIAELVDEAPARHPPARESLRAASRDPAVREVPRNLGGSLESKVTAATQHPTARLTTTEVLIATRHLAATGDTKFPCDPAPAVNF